MLSPAVLGQNELEANKYKTTVKLYSNYVLYSLKNLDSHAFTGSAGTE